VGHFENVKRKSLKVFLEEVIHGLAFAVLLAVESYLTNDVAIDDFFCEVVWVCDVE
jgi:hypothetical protein